MSDSIKAKKRSIPFAEKPYNLYVWENVLNDWTPGVAFAYARDLREAKRMIVVGCKNAGIAESCAHNEIFKKKPKVYKNIGFGFTMVGGA